MSNLFRCRFVCFIYTLTIHYEMERWIDFPVAPYEGMRLIGLFDLESMDDYVVLDHLQYDVNGGFFEAILDSQGVSDEAEAQEEMAELTTWGWTLNRTT